MMLLGALSWLAAGLASAALVVGAWLTATSAVGPGARVAARFARIAQSGKATTATPPRAPNSLLALADPRLPWLTPALAAAKAPFTPMQVVWTEIGLAAVLSMIFTLAGAPPLAGVFLSAVIALVAPLLLIFWLAARRRKRFLRQLPQTIDMIARGLQAGHPASAAMEAAAGQMPDPIGPELGIVVAEMAAGLERDEALRHLAARFPIPELRMLAASLEITRETGGNVSEVLLGLADRLRETAQLRKKIDALAAEGKMSMWVLCALPVVAGGLIMLFSPDYYQEAARFPLFWHMLSVAPVLMLVGAAVIWRLINFRV